MKKIIQFLLVLFIACVFSCNEKEELTDTEYLILKKGENNVTDGKLTLCHYDSELDTWHLISVDKHAVPAHLKHGDVIIDEDGDGYAVFNNCGELNEDGFDCDDTDANVNPGAYEIFDDDIDNDCNGKIDDCTYVPDDNFEQALIDLGYDVPPLDDYVSTIIIEKVTTLNVNNRNICNLTGIESFKALSKLSCRNNQLTTLDLTNNIALTWLDCPENQLISLDLATNIVLNYLSCWDNQLTSLDVTNYISLNILACGYNKLASLDVTNNTNLTWLGCGNNQLTTLDVSKNTALDRLGCMYNQLTTLDVTKNIALTFLDCGYNKLVSLDVTNKTNLTWLECSNNQLTTLDVSKNTALDHLSCWDNQLTNFDVTKNIALTFLACGSNQLGTLNIKNNTALTWLGCCYDQLTSLDLTNCLFLEHIECWANPSLYCIKVANAAEIPFDYDIDDWTVFSEDCGY